MSKDSYSRRSGFTLVELLVVIAIIGILAGIVLNISGYASRKSDRARALSDMERIKLALEEYRINTGRFYTGATNSTDRAFSDAVGKLVPGGIRITDPWGRNYRYEVTHGRSYRLWSTGPSDIATNTEDDVESASGSF